MIFKVNDVIDRLKEHYKIKSDIALSEILGVHKGTVTNWKKRNSLKWDKILAKLKDIDYHWLLTGEYIKRTNDSISVREFINLTNSGHNLPIVLIPEKARAGYTNGFSQEQEIQLPIVSFMGYKDGYKFRAFEIVGNSMEEKIHSGDIAFCEKINLSDYIKVEDIYIIHTKEGLLCKNIEINKKNFILHSINKEYPPQKIEKDNIIEIWKIQWLYHKII